MAFGYSRLVWDGVFDVDPTEKLILLYLANCANAKLGGVAWPGRATIAKNCCITERQAKRVLRSLEKKLWIAAIGRKTGGRSYSTHYRPNLERMADVIAKAVTDSEKGDMDVPVYAAQTCGKGGHGRPEKGDTHAPRTRSLNL